MKWKEESGLTGFPGPIGSKMRIISRDIVWVWNLMIGFFWAPAG